MQHATYITREHIVGTPGTLDKIKFFYNIYVVLTVLYTPTDFTVHMYSSHYYNGTPLDICVLSFSKIIK